MSSVQLITTKEKGRIDLVTFKVAKGRSIHHKVVNFYCKIIYEHRRPNHFSNIAVSDGYVTPSPFPQPPPPQD